MTEAFIIAKASDHPPDFDRYYIFRGDPKNREMSRALRSDGHHSLAWLIWNSEFLRNQITRITEKDKDAILDSAKHSGIDVALVDAPEGWDRTPGEDTQAWGVITSVLLSATGGPTE